MEKQCIIHREMRSAYKILETAAQGPWIQIRGKC